jgi:hypothetical protein
MSFALTMSIALGIAAPLSYSVFSAAGGAMLLGAIAPPHGAQSRTQSTANLATSLVRDSRTAEQQVNVG